MAVLLISLSVYVMLTETTDRDKDSSDGTEDCRIRP